MSLSEISVYELDDLGADVLLVDVREPHEWDDGHIEHATHLPMATIPDHLDLFDGSVAYLVCRSGGRSMRVAEYLDQRGYDVVNVAGGMMAWADAGYAVSPGS